MKDNINYEQIYNEQIYNEKYFEKRQELIEAAIIEFGDKGYENASLNNILKEAGISKGTFYYHFDNKEDLYAYLVNILIDEKKKFFSDHLHPEELNRDFFSLLETLTKTGLEFARSNPHISKFSQSLLKDRDQEIYQKILSNLNVEADDYFENLVDNAYNRGEIREDIPGDFVRRLIAHLFTHLQDITDIYQVDDYEGAVRHLIKFLKGGLEKK